MTVCPTVSRLFITYRSEIIFDQTKRGTVMKTYSYTDCLEKSYRVNWTIDSVLAGRTFDTNKRWLPSALSAADAILFFNEDEKRKLTHIEMGAYAHIFGYVEEFIAPVMTHQAQDFEVDNRPAFDALANFVAEEVKHMNLFRRVRELVNQAIGHELKLIDGADDVARYVLTKNRGGVLLLIDCIEWFTQYHYTTAFKGDNGLDELTKNIFKAHWLEESQHARLDHLEAARMFAGFDNAERDEAINDLIELVQAVDGLLQKQTAYDIENLERYLGRIFNVGEKKIIYNAELRTKRWVFIESGVVHPRFARLFANVTTPAQQQRVQQALAA